MGIQRLIVKYEDRFQPAAKRPRNVIRHPFAAGMAAEDVGARIRNPGADAKEPIGLLPRGGTARLIALIAPSGALIRRGGRSRRLLRLAGKPNQRQRLLVHLAGRLQSRLALEPAQGRTGTRPENAVHLAGIESIVVERLLQLPDLILIERDRGNALTSSGLRRLRSRASLLRQRRKRRRKRAEASPG